MYSGCTGDKIRAVRELGWGRGLGSGHPGEAGTVSKAPHEERWARAAARHRKEEAP